MGHYNVKTKIDHYKDEARICTRNRTHDGNDPDQIVYACNSQEKLVPWLAVLK